MTARGSRSRPRLVYVVTHPVTADWFLRGQLAFMAKEMDVTVIASPGVELDRVAEREGVRCVGVPMNRGVSPMRDAVSLAHLIRAIRAVDPDIVNASTPKAGLLGMLAARALDVPVRIYLLRGLRLETTQGPLRRILAATETVAARCAHEVACVSPSLLAAAIAGGHVPSEKAFVVADGTSNGVDTEHFRRTTVLRAEGARLMEELGIASSEPLVGFVGRPVEDKGVRELLRAFQLVRRDLPNARLVLLGGGLGGERVSSDLAALARAERVITTGAIADLAPYYARMDVLAFPSRREGFPNVPLEAAAAEVPVVGARSTGVTDAVVDGETGTLVPVGDVVGLAAGLLRYLRDRELGAAHGRNARARAVRLFARERVWSAWLDAYRTRLDALGDRSHARS